MKFIIKDSYEEMSKAASDIICEQIKNKPDSVLGLATGSTPIGLYKNLIQNYNDGLISFKNIKTVNLDEYVGLSGDHEQSYRYFMNKTLFNEIDIDKANTFIPDGTASNLEEEAEAYEEKINKIGNPDIQILGIGENGHIGFNEPSSKLEMFTHVEYLTDSTIHANSRFFDSIEDVPTMAISMGIGSIFKAKKIILLASGENKANIMNTLRNAIITPLIPASFLKLHPDVTVIMDKEAGEHYI